MGTILLVVKKFGWLLVKQRDLMVISLLGVHIKLILSNDEQKLTQGNKDSHKFQRFPYSNTGTKTNIKCDITSSQDCTYYI